LSKVKAKYEKGKISVPGSGVFKIHQSLETNR